MKILILQDDFPPQTYGGAGFSAYELAQGFRKIGHQVFVITTCQAIGEEGRFEYDGLIVFRIKSAYPERWRAYFSLYNPQTVPKVKKILKEIKPDAVQVNNIHTHLSYHCLYLAKKYSKCVIFTARDVMTFSYVKVTTKRYLEKFDSRLFWKDHLRQAGRRWNPFRNYIIRKYLNQADKIVAISQSLEEALRQNKITNTMVIYNGLDLRDWEINVGKKEHFLEAYKLKGKNVLFFGGRLSPAKGGDQVFDILQNVIEKDRNVVLLIIGKLDDYAKKLKMKASELCLDQNIIFTGWLDREEIKTAYSASNVVLFLSLHLEAFGRVIIEAMAMKKPVVGTCYGGVPEIIKDRVTGYVTNPLNTRDVANNIIELFQNTTLVSKYGEAGYERVKKMFELGQKVNEYVNFIEAVINKKND